MKLHASRRHLLLGAGALLALPVTFRRAQAQDAPIKVAGVHASPVENAWNSRVHLALQQAAEQGLITYEFSEGIAATDYPRAMREYAEAGAQLVLGESYAVENEAREVAADYPRAAFLMGSSGEPAGDNFGVVRHLQPRGRLPRRDAGREDVPDGQVRLGRRLPDSRGEPPHQRLPPRREGGEPRRDLHERLHRRLVRPRQGQGGRHRPDRRRVRHPLRRADRHRRRRAGEGQAIGSLTDYSDRYPDTVFASAVWNFGPTVEAVVADIKAGNPVGKSYTEYSFMRHGGNELVYNADMVPADAIPPMEAKRDEITSGAFEVPIDPAEPS